MARNLFLLSVLLCQGLSSPLCGADGWTKLKLGMTVEDAEAALGAPLIRNEGRGFERWVYDGRAEVLFYGGVIAWTAPASTSTLSVYVQAHAPVEVWQFYQAIPNRLRDPIPTPLRKRLSAPRGNAPVGPDLGSSFRYARRS